MQNCSNLMDCKCRLPQLAEPELRLRSLNNEVRLISHQSAFQKPPFVIETKTHWRPAFVHNQHSLPGHMSPQCCQYQWAVMETCPIPMLWGALRFCVKSCSSVCVQAPLEHHSLGIEFKKKDWDCFLPPNTGTEGNGKRVDRLILAGLPTFKTYIACLYQCKMVNQTYKLEDFQITPMLIHQQQY